MPVDGFDETLSRMRNKKASLCLFVFSSQQDLDAIQSISAGLSVKKDAEEAAKCREKGNSIFKTRDYKAAALHYSQVE